MKQFLIKLFTDTLLPPDHKIDLDFEIQRVHRDPARPHRSTDRPRRILVNFSSYLVKERILDIAWGKKEINTGGYKYFLRHYIGPRTSERRWELAKLIDPLKENGC